MNTFVSFELSCAGCGCGCTDDCKGKCDCSDCTCTNCGKACKSECS